jgi:hypothetical protein
MVRIFFATLGIVLATLLGCDRAVKSEPRGFRVTLPRPCILRDFADPGDAPTVVLELFTGRDPEINGKRSSPDKVAAESRFL